MGLGFPKSIKNALAAPFKKENLNTFLAPTKTVLNFGKEVVQGTARSGASVGATISEMYGGPNELFPTSRFETALYGSEPIKSLTTRTREAATSTRDLGQRYFKKDIGKFGSTVLALPTVVGMTALDFTGAGKSDDAFKLIAKSENSKKILTQLTRLGVKDNTAKVLSRQLVKVSDPIRVKTILENFIPKVKVNQFPTNVKGVIPRALGQGEKYAKTAQERMGFFTRPIMEGSNQAGFLDVGEVAKSAGTTKRKLETELIDRYAPIKNFIGKNKLSADSDPYIAARNFAGRFGKVQNRLDNLGEILRPSSKILDKAKEYAKLERFEELSKRGITKFEGGLSIEKVLENKATLEKTLGKQLPEVRTFLDQLRGYSDNLLTEAKDAGIISDSAFKAIKKNNQKYIPLHRLEYLADQADNLPRGAKTFSVATQNVIKAIKGSEKEVADPIESIVRNTYKTVELIERNKVAQKVADLSKLDEFKDLVVPVKGSIPRGFDKLSVLKNGVKEEYAIPKELADSLKGLNEKNIDIVTQLAGKLGGFLRAGATSLNIGFIPANAIRDYQTATLVSKVGFTPWDWLKGFSEAVRKGDDYKAFLDSGGSYSGFFEQTKKLSKTVKELKQGKMLSAVKTVVNPIKLMQRAGETIELAPRLGVFKRSLKKGLSSTEAAFNAREATVDFAKSGSIMKIANLWVPFLNARTQGTINVLKAVKQRPIRSAVVIGSMIELPVIATYYHNTKFHKDTWDSIAQHEKDNNFIIIYGDKTDEEGNPTQVIKIPKGDVGKVFGNPTENFLAYLDKNDPKSVGQVVAETFSSLSPVDFVQNGEVSGRTALSGITPPTLKGGFETVTNKNLFTGRSIVPENLKDASPEQQYNENTSPVAVKLGQFLGWSPMKIENFVGTQFGGLGRQLLDPAKAPGQVAGRFSGAKGGEQEQKDFKTLDKLKTEDVDARVIAERKAKKLFTELKELPTDQRGERIQDLLQRGDIDLEVVKELGQAVEDEAKNLDSFERAFRSKSNDVKARFLVEKLKTLPVEERRAYFQNLAEKGLLSKQLIQEITKEIKEQAN